MNGYAEQAAHHNEDWLISPAIEIGADEWEEITFEFRSAMKYDGNPIQVFVSSDYDGQSDPSDFEWEEIEGEELFARAMLHEMDHLDGILYVDKVEGELMDVEQPEEE